MKKKREYTHLAPCPGSPCIACVRYRACPGGTEKIGCQKWRNWFGRCWRRIRRQAGKDGA